MYFPRKWVWKYTNTFFIESFEPQVGRFCTVAEISMNDILNFIHSDKTLFQIMSAFEHVKVNLPLQKVRDRR